MEIRGLPLKLLQSYLSDRKKLTVCQWHMFRYQKYNLWSSSRVNFGPIFIHNIHIAGVHVSKQQFFLSGSFFAALSKIRAFNQLKALFSA